MVALIDPRQIAQRRAFPAVVLLDAVLGTIIAVASIAYQFSEVPFPGMSRLRDMTTFMGFTLTNSGGIVLFVVPAFLSTLVLTPPFIRFLRSSDRSPVYHYRFGVISGCVFGVIATAGTCFFLGAMAAFLPAQDATIWTRIVVLVGGPPFMAMSGGMAFSVIFWKEIVIGGAAFGLFNAWLVRHLPRTATDSGLGTGGSRLATGDSRLATRD